jgi:hypothetical protein
MGGVLILHAFEKAEKAYSILIKSIVILVLDRDNSAYDLSSSLGYKKFDLGMLKERMFLPVEKIFLVAEKRGNPMGIIPVHLPRQQHKLPKSLPISNGFDDEVVPRHGSEYTDCIDRKCVPSK